MSEFHAPFGFNKMPKEGKCASMAGEMMTFTEIMGISTQFTPN